MPMVKTPLAEEYALLGFLRQKPMHAYEMYSSLTQAQALGLVWHIKQSQLYALLTRLEEAGYVVGTTEQQGTRPPRKVLHLTPEGEAAFDLWRVTPVAHGRDIRIEFLAKLFFATQHGPQTVKTLIAAQHAAAESWLADLRAQHAAADLALPFDTLVLQYRIGQIAATLVWLDTCAATLLPAQ